MANTLTAIAQQAFSAAYKVSQEPIGVLDAISLDFDNKGVALNDTVKVPIAPVATASAFTPAATSSAGSNQTATAVSVAITNQSYTSRHLTGEEIRSLENGGIYGDWAEQWLMQSMRTLRNEMEAAAWAVAYKAASRAVGTAGTTPFATSVDILADLRKVLRDNGAPLVDTSLILNTAAVVNLMKLDIYQQANLNGTAEERRNGSLPKYFGMQLLDSAQVSTHTKGTATGYDVNLLAGYAIGEKVIAVDGSDSGTILGGDVITWAGDTNNYVVSSATASGAASGNITLNDPGLRATLANAVEGTTGDTYTANVALERSSVVGIVRPTLFPQNPTIQQMTISDPFGMNYLLLEVAQHGMKSWELHVSYGFKAVQSEHIAILMG